MGGISLFDLIIIVSVLLLGIKGIINGFVKEAFGLIGIIGGVFVAYRYASGFGGFVSSKIYEIPNEASLYLVGFISLLLIIWLLSIIVGFLLGKMVSLSGLTSVDRILGFVTGSFKIFLVLAILFALLSKIDFVKTKLDVSLENSFVYPALIASGNLIIKIEPTKIIEIQDSLKPQNIEDIKNSTIRILSESVAQGEK